MDRETHAELFRLLGWKEDEIQSFLPDWMKAAKLLRLDDTDVSEAVKHWIPEYWDLSLKSVRMFISVFLRETAELSKVKKYLDAGDKVIYCVPTSSYACLYANVIAGKGKVHVFYPDFIMTTVRQAFFGLFSHQICSEDNFSTDCLHCALNSNRARFSICGLLPAPTVTWNWVLECTESGKTEEQISFIRKEPRNSVILSLPHDVPLGMAEAENEDRVAYFAEEIKATQKQVSSFTGVEVCEEDMREAMNDYRAYMTRLEELTDLVILSDPQPMSGLDLSLMSACEEVCFSVNHRLILDALDEAIAEVKERIQNGTGILPKGAPKLACNSQSLGSPWIGKAFPENGVNIALGRVFPPISWLKPEEDPWKESARFCLMNPGVVNMKDEIAITVRLFQQFHFDGALYGGYTQDRWLGALHKLVIKEVEKQTGVPHYYLETDFWNPEKNRQEDRKLLIRNICNSIKILDL